MTDWINFPQAQRQSSGESEDYRLGAVARWLWFVAACVFLMVIVGGATRLTESGLSITEWKPITGVIPPWGEEVWAVAFEKYKQIPQYRELFPDMDLARFKVIYAWEWAHRLLGRLIGVIFALPLAYFWARGYLTKRLKWSLLGVLALGGLQGFVGWWMVASGLVNRVEVAQERLSIHLVLASVTFAALVWLATGLRRKAAYPSTSALKLMGSCLIGVVLLQIGLGGLVAGLRAGLVYNTWPLMDGAFVPPAEYLWQLMPWWSNLLDNVTTVQFVHRMTAYALAFLVLVHAFMARGGRMAGLARALAGLTLLQIVFGILTLLFYVPISVAMLHQAFAMVVLAMAVVNRRVQSPPASSAFSFTRVHGHRSDSDQRFKS